MQDVVSEFEGYLDGFLQHVVIVRTDDEILRSGKLLLYRHKDFGFQLTLFNLRRKKTEMFKLPYPFAISSDGREVFLDYHPELMFKTKETLKWYQRMKKPSPATLLGKIVTIAVTHPPTH